VGFSTYSLASLSPFPCITPNLNPYPVTQHTRWQPLTHNHDPDPDPDTDLDLFRTPTLKQAAALANKGVVITPLQWPPGLRGVDFNPPGPVEKRLAKAVWSIQSSWLASAGDRWHVVNSTHLPGKRAARAELGLVRELTCNTIHARVLFYLHWSCTVTQHLLVLALHAPPSPIHTFTKSCSLYFPVWTLTASQVCSPPTTLSGRACADHDAELKARNWLLSH
jgi:hypothetical protein